MLRTLAAILLLYFINFGKCQSYLGGVVVFKPDEQANLIPKELVSSNIQEYVKIIQENKNNVDILVFPEFGISSIRARDRPVEHLNDFSIPAVGNVNDIICGLNKTKSNLESLSCAAKENNIYVVVNLVEEANKKFYITTIGLDPNGTLCLKCRKQRIGNGTHFEVGLFDKSCTFTANFRKNIMVPFTVLFETDLVYGLPEAIKNDNVIVTSFIKNTLPLNIGLSLYQGFAINNKINLLAAGYYDTNVLNENYGGSGIYFSNGTSIVAFKPDNSDEQNAKGKILLANIPVKNSYSPTIQTQSTLVGDVMNIGLQYMNIPALNNFNKTVQNCTDKKCCNFQADIVEDSITPYKWVVLSNKTVIVNQEVDIFLCALIIPSANYPSKVFKNATISTNMEKSKIVQTFPLAIGPNMTLLGFTYTNETNLYSVSLDKESNVIAFGILHVIDINTEPGTNVVLIVIISLLCIALVVTFIGYLIWRTRQKKNRRAL